MASFTDLNTFIPQVINQYQEPFYNKMLRASPIMNLVPRRTYDNADGLSPIVITTTSSLPTDYPTMGSLARSNGTGAAACTVTADKIQQGYTSQTYSLETKAFESEILCATDLDFGPNGLAGTAQTIANYYKNMELNVRTFWEDWYRIKNLSIIQNKVSTLVNDLADTVTDTNANFSGVDAPTDVLQWSHLDPLWDLALNTGMSELSPVTSAGMPAFFLVVSPRTKRRLFQYDQLVRDTVNWQTGDAALENFKAMGIDTAINGFVPIVDPRPIRYANDKTTKIYPFVNQATTAGVKWVANPNYKPVSQGGLAVYEVATIMCNNIWEARPRATGLGNIGGASFDPINYTGEFCWINNKDNASNPRGNQGYFRADVQVAGKPIFPEYGFQILVKVDEPAA